MVYDSVLLNSPFKQNEQNKKHESNNERDQHAEIRPRILDVIVNSKSVHTSSMAYMDF